MVGDSALGHGSLSCSFKECSEGNEGRRQSVGTRGKASGNSLSKL